MNNPLFHNQPIRLNLGSVVVDLKIMLQDILSAWDAKKTNHVIKMKMRSYLCNQKSSGHVQYAKDKTIAKTSTNQNCPGSVKNVTKFAR